MKKLLTLILFLGVTLTLAGCDYLDQDLVDRVKDYADNYCEENPDSEYCNLDFEAELEKVEMKLEEYFADYSNAELTNQDIADKYFEGELPDGFEEERDQDLEDEAVLTLKSIDFRLDGGFDITFTTTPKGMDGHDTKRPGRIKFNPETGGASITWYDGEDNDCDDSCDFLEEIEDAKETFADYFEDYTDKEISHQDFADMYFGGVLTEEFKAQRDKDLADEVEITLLDVVEREADSFFDITYAVSRAGVDSNRKRPGGTLNKNNSSLVVWGGAETCDGVDDDCN